MKTLMNNSEFDIEFTLIDGSDLIEEIKQLFLEYAQSLKVDLSFQDFNTEIGALPGKYSPPEGALILALIGHKPAGCIALRKISDDVCEMKRLYVRDNYKGLGIGKKLINLILEEATRIGYRFIRLDTLPSMKKAQDLYQALGFYDIEPYVYNPIVGTRFMELRL
jgi:ribosomal protein S18 acetylase RimI-like enzyme